MKKLFFVMVIFSLLLTHVFNADAQTQTQTQTQRSPQTFDTTDFPQWAKDLRRWNIITFGAFPFGMFYTRMITDFYRWNENSGMDWSEQGRRYAPWPLTSAGAVPMTKEEFERTLMIAAGFAMTVAFTDLIIINVRRNAERRRIESMPAGRATINRFPYGIINEEIIEQDITEEIISSETE